MGKGEGQGAGKGEGQGGTDRLACPALPLPAAIVCCILNIFVPGLGTIIAGFISACCGDHKDMDNCQVCGGVCISILIGLAQLVTIVFGLVGWIWSIVWGVFMIGQSLDYKAKRERENNRDSPGNHMPGTAQVFIVTNTTVNQGQPMAGYSGAGHYGPGLAAGPGTAPAYSPPMVPPTGGKLLPPPDYSGPPPQQASYSAPPPPYPQ